MTEAHVPPRGIGNDRRARERAQWVTSAGGARLSGWKPGGLSVYGLCRDCNHLTSDKADPAYIDFHNAVLKLWAPSQRFLRQPGMVPAPVAPGLVARSVLAGMYAINDRLQELFPELAAMLIAERRDMRLPEGLTLRLGLTDGTWSRIGGPVGYMQVLSQRRTHMPLAEIWFPPLAWCLRSTRSTDDFLGPELTENWADVTDWVRYGPDLSTDLRNVAGPLPLVRPPQFGGDEWIVLTGDAMAALEGRPVRR